MRIVNSLFFSFLMQKVLKSDNICIIILRAILLRVRVLYTLRALLIDRIRVVLHDCEFLHLIYKIHLGECDQIEYYLDVFVLFSVDLIRVVILYKDIFVQFFT